VFIDLEEAMMGYDRALRNVLWLAKRRK